MGQRVWADITTSTSTPAGVLYHLRRFIKNLETAWPGRLSVIDDYAGTSGNWDSEAGVGEGAWIVVQAGHAYPGSSVKWQCLIGARKTTTGTIAGYTVTMAVGLWSKLSVNGGWNSQTKVFDNTPVTGFWEAKNELGWAGVSTITRVACVEKIVSGSVVGEALILNMQRGSLRRRVL